HSVAPYLYSLDTPDSRAFKARVAQRFGAGRRISSFFATAYATVRLCADAGARCGGDDPRAVRSALHAIKADSVLGPLMIDAATNHASLPFHLARIAGDGFAVIRSRPK